MLYCSAKTQTLKQLPGPALVKETISSPDGSHIAGGIMREVSGQHAARSESEGGRGVVIFIMEATAMWEQEEG